MICKNFDYEVIQEEKKLLEEAKEHINGTISIPRLNLEHVAVMEQLPAVDQVQVGGGPQGDDDPQVRQ